MKPELASVILEIRFSSPFDLVQIKDTRPGIFKKITGEEPPAPPKQQIASGLSFNNQKQFLRVVLEPKRIALRIENKTKEEAIETIENTFNLIYEDVNCQTLEIQRIGARTIWLNQYDQSFTALLDIYKKRFYQKSLLRSEAKDVAVTLTLENEGLKVNFITAPISKKQLQNQVLVFKRNLNHDYALTDIDVFNEDFKNNKTEIINFLKKSILYGEKKTKEIFNILFQQ